MVLIVYLLCAVWGCVAMIIRVEMGGFVYIIVTCQKGIMVYGVGVGVVA